MRTPRVMTVAEVAAYVRTSSKTIYRLIDQNKLRAFKLEHEWRIRLSDVKRYQRQNSTVPQR